MPIDLWSKAIPRSSPSNGSVAAVTKDMRPRQQTKCRVRRADLLKKLLSTEVRGYYGFQISIASPKLHRRMFGDVKGDLLDAFLCAIQGAWAWVNQEAHFGIHEYCDSNEGWITDPAVGSSAPVHKGEMSYDQIER